MWWQVIRERTHPAGVSSSFTGRIQTTVIAFLAVQDAVTFAGMLQNFQLANQTMFIAVILLVIGMIGLITRRGPVRRAFSLGIIACSLLLWVGSFHSLVENSAVRRVGWMLLLCLAALVAFVLAAWKRPAQPIAVDDSIDGEES